MEFTALHLLWLLLAFTLASQESGKLKLTVSPAVPAECGKEVSLHCNASSSQHGLSIKNMEWSQGNTSLCSVNSEQTMTTHQRHSLSDFYCEYKDGRLLLVIQGVLPLESSKPYRCKLHSNQGVAHKYTKVELQECCGTTEYVLTTEGPNCTFNRVYPDGDVDWFHGSHNLSDGSVKFSTAKSVDEHGWLTIRSWLTIPGAVERRTSHVPYNCSLKSSTSGRYLASTLVQKRDFKVRWVGETGWEPALSAGRRVRPQKTIATALSLVLFFTWR